jgi:hypothetical protein
MNKKKHRAIAGVFLFAVFSYQPGYRHLAGAEEPSASSATEAFPEGSSSVIESLTWRVTAHDPVTLHEQVKVLVGQISEAVVVKESESLLVVSLPTQKLSALHQELSKLGSVSPPEEEAVPSAPTTLLRLMFVR